LGGPGGGVARAGVLPRAPVLISSCLRQTFFGLDNPKKAD
jgi:hypothetical protein